MRTAILCSMVDSPVIRATAWPSWCILPASQPALLRVCHTCIIDITMATEVTRADLTEHHGLSNRDDSIEIAQSLKLCLFISTYNVELREGRGRVCLSRPYLTPHLATCVYYIMTYLFNVVQRLFVALEPHNDGVRDHHGGKLHHLLIVGGREQYHLTGLGPEPAVSQPQRQSQYM